MFRNNAHFYRFKYTSLLNKFTPRSLFLLSTWFCDLFFGVCVCVCIKFVWYVLFWYGYERDIQYSMDKFAPSFKSVWLPPRVRLQKHQLEDVQISCLLFHMLVHNSLIISNYSVDRFNLNFQNFFWWFFEGGFLTTYLYNFCLSVSRYVFYWKWCTTLHPTHFFEGLILFLSKYRKVIITQTIE